MKTIQQRFIDLISGITLTSLIIILSVVGVYHLNEIAPLKVDLIYYKTVLILIALSVAYLADIAFFSQQRPSKLVKLIDREGEDDLKDPEERRNMYWLLCAINIRRAIIMGSLLIAYMTGL